MWFLGVGPFRLKGWGGLLTHKLELKHTGNAVVHPMHFYH